jgi:hypothetical protein
MPLIECCVISKNEPVGDAEQLSWQVHVGRVECRDEDYNKRYVEYLRLEWLHDIGARDEAVLKVEPTEATLQLSDQSCLR